MTLIKLIGCAIFGTDAEKDKCHAITFKCLYNLQHDMTNLSPLSCMAHYSGDAFWGSYDTNNEMSNYQLHLYLKMANQHY